MSVVYFSGNILELFTSAVEPVACDFTVMLELTISIESITDTNVHGVFLNIFTF